ncbi:cytochrome c oxidase subunit II [Paracidovorax sp. MALMAid1276]|uniref:cytochrome c oxidase subunit II n=1 Tax=Paracidovorax sp. MALMAid1276 TaxID=3411631 RepID=UPI003B9A2B57
MQGVTGDGRAAQDGLWGRRVHASILPWPALALLLAGCQGPLSTLDAAGPSAQAIATVWWWMLAVAILVLAGVVAAWMLAMRRGAAPQGDGAQQSAGRTERRWLVWGGLVLPSVCIAALVALGSPAGLHQLPLPGKASGVPAPLQIEAIGHQWWWEVRYPGHARAQRNEMRIPAGRPVDVITGSADVIHSFWVPRLGGKLDAVPGRSLRVRLQAHEPGTYRGQCAEFCGVGHAHMGMTVIAMEADAFDAWLAGAGPAAATSEAGGTVPQRGAQQ